MSAADRASAADLSCPGAVCLHCQFVPYGTRCAYVAHLSCPGAVCLHRRFVPYGTWCAYVAHLSCPGRGAHTPPICHVRGAMCIRRPFVMFERGAPAPPICYVRGAMCIRRPFVMFGRGAPAPPICYVRGAMRLHRPFVMSGTRCAYTADLSCPGHGAPARRGWARCICANCMCPAHDSNSVMQSRAHTDRNLIGMARDLRMRAAPAQAAYISTAHQQNQARRPGRRRTTPRNAANGAFARLSHAMPLSYGHAARRGSRAARHCVGTRRFEAVPAAWRVDCAFRRLRPCFTFGCGGWDM